MNFIDIICSWSTLWLNNFFHGFWSTFCLVLKKNTLKLRVAKNLSCYLLNCWNFELNLKKKIRFSEQSFLFLNAGRRCWTRPRIELVFVWPTWWSYSHYWAVYGLWWLARGTRKLEKHYLRQIRIGTQKSIKNTTRAWFLKQRRHSREEADVPF